MKRKVGVGCGKKKRKVKIVKFKQADKLVGHCGGVEKE